MKSNLIISGKGQRVHIDVQGDADKPVYMLSLPKSKERKEIIPSVSDAGTYYWTEKGRKKMPLTQELNELIDIAFYQHPDYWGI